MTLVAALVLAGCGSAPAKTASDQPKPVAQQSIDPVVACTQQVMSAVIAGLNDEIENASNGTTGFREFTQKGFEMGRESQPYQIALQILPPLIPVLSNQGEAAAINQGTSVAKQQCTGYIQSTD